MAGFAQTTDLHTRRNTDRLPRTVVDADHVCGSIDEADGAHCRHCDLNGACGRYWRSRVVSARQRDECSEHEQSGNETTLIYAHKYLIAYARCVSPSSVTVSIDKRASSQR